MTKFEEGKKYYMFSPCDTNAIWKYTVIRRTAKTVILSDGKDETRCRVKEYGGQEFCKPIGSYSMSPTLRAERSC